MYDILLRNLTLINNNDQTILLICHNLIEIIGCNPFKSIDGISIFEIAIDNYNEELVNLFILYWLKKPNWDLNNEIYKLEYKNNIHMTKFIFKILNNWPFKKNYIINQALTILQIYLGLF